MQSLIECYCRRLYRVYPSGGRLGLSWWISGHNLDPVVPWSVGCQLAALNMQCRDRCYRLNTGRFRLNRRCVQCNTERKGKEWVCENELSFCGSNQSRVRKGYGQELPARDSLTHVPINPVIIVVGAY
jgi:hypothetical protein